MVNKKPKDMNGRLLGEGYYVGPSRIFENGYGVYHLTNEGEHFFLKDGFGKAQIKNPSEVGKSLIKLANGLEDARFIFSREGINFNEPIDESIPF